MKNRAASRQVLGRAMLLQCERPMAQLPSGNDRPTSALGFSNGLHSCGFEPLMRCENCSA